MREPKIIDYALLTILALIWASAVFNIKIATYSYGPVTIAFLRIFFGAIPVICLCLYKKIKIEGFSKDWRWFASIGLINLVIPNLLNLLRLLNRDRPQFSKFRKCSEFSKFSNFMWSYNSIYLFIFKTGKRNFIFDINLFIY